MARARRCRGALFCGTASHRRNVHLLPTAITALEHFCQGRFAEMLSQVPGRERTRLLFLAIQRGNVEAVRALLAAEASVTATNYRGHTPLMVAAFAEQPEIVRILLDAGADPNFLAKTSADDPGDLALGLALTAGAMGSAQVLLEKGADPKALHDGSPMLHVAVGADLPEALALLVKAGADVNARAIWEHQPTAMMVAAGTGKSAQITQLLELNADPAAADSEGHTARDYAATHKKREALEQLKSFPGRCPMSGCSPN